jgi:hypothetical protein
MTLDVVEQCLVLRNQSFPPPFGFVVFEACNSVASGQIRKRLFDFGDIDAAHQSAEILALPAFGFVRRDQPVVGERLGRLAGNAIAARCSSFSSASCWPSPFRRCASRLRGLARFLVDHRINVSRISGVTHG